MAAPLPHPDPSIPTADVFLGRVTHDLRGELSTMIAGVHYLLRYESGVGPSGRQMLDRVNGAGQRLRRLLDELELSAWIGGAPNGPSPAIEPCRIEALVEGAIGRLGNTIAQRAVTIDLGFGDLPEVEVDPHLVGSAIELVIDFSIARSTSKIVRVTGATEEGAAVLRVADDGGDVDPSLLARVFEPFFEREIVHKPEPGARRRERLGLGLAIARGVFAAHGGAVTALPIAHGIAVTLRLPARGCLAPPAV